MFLNKKANNYGLLIAAFVAIVAIVGLVLHDQGGPTGQFIDLPELRTTPSYRSDVIIGTQADVARYEEGLALGASIYDQKCEYDQFDQIECCSRTCGDSCRTGEFGHQSDNVCHDGCIQRCQLLSAQGLSSYIQTR